MPVPAGIRRDLLAALGKLDDIETAPTPARVAGGLVANA